MRRPFGSLTLILGYIITLIGLAGEIPPGGTFGKSIVHYLCLMPINYIGRDHPTHRASLSVSHGSSWSGFVMYTSNELNIGMELPESCLVPHE